MFNLDNFYVKSSYWYNTNFFKIEEKGSADQNS